MKFTKQKNGYDEKQVDDYLSTLILAHQNELSEKDSIISKLECEVKAVKDKEKSIGLALTAAIDKAKEIEQSSQNIYKLKLEQITMLYSKWEVLFNELLKKYPGIEDISNVREDMNNLKNSIQTALKDDFNIDLMTKTPATDPIRILLTRLTGARAEARETATLKKVKVIPRKTKISTNDKTDLSKLEEKASQIKPISNINLEHGENYKNIVDKFLNTDNNNEVPDGLSKILSMPDYSNNNSKFDLNEAINPKEGLDEIMKSFDFYKK